MKKISLAEALEGIEDRRREKSVMHSLHEVLIIMLLAIICGATSYAKIEMFGKSKEEWLKKFLKLENGIPDACTFRNIVKEIDTAQLHTIFCEWMKGIASDLCGVIAIDGKEARATKDKNKKSLHVVSAFSYECGLVLGQLACDEKSNEITAIPQLLEMLEINGCIVTIDAMGTQTDIAEKIVNRNADYILALKANQSSLYNDVKLFMDDIKRANDIQNGDCYYCTLEKAHGRIEKRECFIHEEISWISTKDRWAKLQGIGAIYTHITENGQTVKQSHYFIYSCNGLSAKTLMECKRNHWSIENSLHWVLDMAFREDESRARKDNSVENLNVLRQIAFNILKSDTSFKGGLTDKQFRCLLDNSYLENLFLSWLCS